MTRLLLIGSSRRDALARLTHTLLELGAKLTLVGLGSKAGYACPLSQNHFADALGLTTVHVNRVLRQLREKGLATFNNGQVVFDNYDRLVKLAEFDPVYLDENGPLL